VKPLTEQFEVAGGSVAGRDHRHSLRNSQDAYHCDARRGVIAAVVCDGCGSGEHSEVGAQIGARLAVEEILRNYHRDPFDFGFASGANGIDSALARVQRSILAKIQLLADAMGSSFTENIGEYFLFTLVGAIVTETGTFIFSCGDGIFSLNGDVTRLTSKDNRPDYISYGLVESGIGAPKLSVQVFQPTVEVSSLLIGTDGCEALLDAVDTKIPGKEDKVGPINQFWSYDRYFKNPFAVGHRLNLINRDMARYDPEKKVMIEEHGPLRDDTTFIVIRRKKA